MCVVSQITDYGRGVFPHQPHQWPYTSPNTVPGQPWPQPYTPPSKTVPVTPAVPTSEEMQKWIEAIEAFRALVAAGEVFDRVTGQPDCVDPEKAELMDRLAAMEERIKQLESGAGQD